MSNDLGQADPYRHWDGQRWLRWSGTEWLPESAAPVTPTPPPAAVAGTAGRRRVWWVIAAVVVVGAVSTAIALTRGGSNSGSAGSAGPDAGGSTAAFPTRAATCGIEANVGMDVEANTLNGSIYSAIGSSGPMITIVNQVLPTYEQDVSQVGINDAETEIITPIDQACMQAGNPILTSGQVQGLTQIATSGDANSLQQVTLFASDPTTGK